jgi:adenylate kinase family enzyme
MTSGPQPPVSLIAIVGPPVAGKTTVAQQLLRGGEAQVFHLDRFVRRGCRDGWLHPDALACLDPYTDRATTHLDSVLQSAFLDGRFPAAADRVALDGFPHTATHLRLLRDTSRACGARLGVIELTADDVTLATRCTQRRRCLVCTPDAADAVYRFAPPEPEFAAQCPTCSASMMIRAVDDRSVFLDRLCKYRNWRDAVQDSAQDLDIPWLVIDTTREPQSLSYMAEVRAAITQIEEHAARPPQPRGGSR